MLSTLTDERGYAWYTKVHVTYTLRTRYNNFACNSLVITAERNTVTMHTVIDGNNFKDSTPHANDLYLFPHISVIPRPCRVPWVHKCVLRRPLFTPLKYHISDNLRQNILGQVSFVYFSTTKLNALPLPLNQCWEYGFCKYFNWNICAEHLALNKYCIAISQHWFGGWGENPALYCQKTW